MAIDYTLVMRLRLAASARASEVELSGIAELDELRRCRADPDDPYSWNLLPPPASRVEELTLELLRTEGAIVGPWEVFEFDARPGRAPRYTVTSTREGALVGLVAGTFEAALALAQLEAWLA